MAKSAGSERRLRPHLGWTACDAVAVACALHPELVTAAKDVFVDIELRGEGCAGRLRAARGRASCPCALVCGLKPEVGGVGSERGG